MMMPLRRLDVDVDIGRHVSMLAGYHGPSRLPGKALAEAYRVYKDMKTLGFFRLAAERLGNSEEPKRLDGRTYDLFVADPSRGKLLVIVETSMEAASAFLDDGLIMLKLRGWLGETLKRFIDESLGKSPRSQLDTWERLFYGKGSPLPRGVRAIPFFSAEFIPSVPALTLILIKTRDMDKDENAMEHS